MKLQRRQFSVSFQNKLEDDNKLGKYCEEQFLLNHYLGRTEHNIRIENESNLSEVREKGSFKCKSGFLTKTSETFLCLKIY